MSSAVPAAAPAAGPKLANGAVSPTPSAGTAPSSLVVVSQNAPLLSKDKGGGDPERHASRSPRPQEPPKPATNLFSATNDLKKGKKVDPQEVRDAANADYGNKFFGRLAKNQMFENITLIVITLNACLIGYDADYTARWGKPDQLFDGPAQFIVFEIAFCIYFTAEIVIRFLGFRKWHRCFCNAWFVFDSVLVSMMLFETVVLPIIGNSGPFGQLSMLRLLRLLRMTRMAKLMRAFPQILMIVKGMTAAMRAVGWVAVLLVIITFTFSIMFVNEFHQGRLTDEECEPGSVEEIFGSMGKSMLTLIVLGTILDDVSVATTAIRENGNMAMLLVFLCYIVLNSFTMMNLLIGILVEVVGSTAEGEKTRLIQEGVKEQMTTIFNGIDEDGSGEISQEEFQNMKGKDEVMKALAELEIGEKQFDLYGELLFQGDPEEQLDFEELMDCICRLRPDAHVSALDFAVFKEFVATRQSSLQERILRIGKQIRALGEQSILQKMPGTCYDQGPRKDDTTCAPVVCDMPDVLNGGPSKTPSNSDSPRAYPPRPPSVMLQDLERVSRADIIRELQRRCCAASRQDNNAMRDHEDSDSCQSRGNLPMAPFSHAQQGGARGGQAGPAWASDKERSSETIAC